MNLKSYFFLYFVLLIGFGLRAEELHHGGSLGHAEEPSAKHATSPDHEALSVHHETTTSSRDAHLPDASGAGAPSSPSANHKFEDLFIWKISDELRLPDNQEKKFADFIHDLSRKKNLLNSEIQKTLEKLSLGETNGANGTGTNGTNGTTKVQSASSLKMLNEYRNQIKKLNALNLEEIDQIKKILGSKKAVRYFILKNELANQFKARLVNPDSETSKGKADLPAPKLIEEE